MGTRLIRDADSGSIKPNRQNVQQGSEQYKQEIIDEMKRELNSEDISPNREQQLQSIIDKFDDPGVTVTYTLVHQATDSAGAFKSKLF